MCDDPSHAIYETEIARLQEANQVLMNTVERPVYVTVTPTPSAYTPPDPNTAIVMQHLNSISLSLGRIANKLDSTTP